MVSIGEALVQSPAPKKVCLGTVALVSNSTTQEAEAGGTQV